MGKVCERYRAISKDLAGFSSARRIEKLYVYSETGDVIMHSKLWIAVFSIAILVFPAHSYPQEDSYKVKKLVRLGDGRTEAINRDSENLVEIRDLIGRDRTPEEGLRQGDNILSGRYVHCGTGIGVALQANNNEVIWMNSETTVQIKDGSVIVDMGEVYTKARNLKLGFTDAAVIDPTGNNGVYIKAGSEEGFLYLFSGNINVGSHTVNEEKPLARITSQDFQILGANEPYKEIEERAKMWRKSIRSVTVPFWQKPKFYVPTTAAAVAAGIGIAIYYFTRPPEVSIRVEISR
jgi:hypothetical protein